MADSRESNDTLTLAVRIASIFLDVLALAMSALALAAYIKFPTLWTSTNVYIACSSIATILLSTVDIAMSAVPGIASDFNLDIEALKLREIVESMLAYFIVFCSTAVAVHRLAIVKRARRFTREINAFRTLAGCFVATAYILCVLTTPLYGFGTLQLQTDICIQRKMAQGQMELLGQERWSLSCVIYPCLRFTTLFVAPFCVNVISYCLIFSTVKISTQAGDIRSLRWTAKSSLVRRSVVGKGRTSATRKNIIVTIVLFMVCLCPHEAYLLYVPIASKHGHFQGEMRYYCFNLLWPALVGCFSFAHVLLNRGYRAAVFEVTHRQTSGQEQLTTTTFFLNHTKLMETKEKHRPLQGQRQQTLEEETKIEKQQDQSHSSQCLKKCSLQFNRSCEEDASSSTAVKLKKYSETRVTIDMGDEIVTPGEPDESCQKEAQDV